MSERGKDNRFVPFHYVDDDEVEEFGFTKDGMEQRLYYPEHMNVATRIYYDPSRHAVQVEPSRDDNRPSIVFVSLGTGEMNETE